MATDMIVKLLSERDKQDQVYRLTCEVANLHAVQGRIRTAGPSLSQSEVYAPADVLTTSRPVEHSDVNNLLPRAVRRNKR